MDISISDLVLPVNPTFCVLAGISGLALAWVIARLRAGKCPFHFSSIQQTEPLNMQNRATTNGAAPPMDKPLRASDPTHREFLADLQGNILSGHGRDHAAHIFVQFKPDEAAAAKKWLAAFARTHIVSAEQQLHGSRQFRLHGIDAGLFAHLAISASGYKALGFSTQETPQGLNPRNHDDSKGYDEVYCKGLKARQEILNDPALSDWEEAYKNDLHMLVMLAADDDAQLDDATQSVLGSLKAISSKLHVERGLGLTKQLNPSDPTTTAHVEHFGYVDGRSQPLMLEEQIELERKRGSKKWDASAPLNLVLAPDPNGKSGLSYGSFLVFRKLEQNVRGFHKAVNELAAKLGVSPELAQAMVMGRFKDGTPVSHRDNGGTSDVSNDFDFSDDTDGSRCPFQAHIRKSNPRLSSTGKSELRHRIARRGIPYGGTLIESERLEDLPENGRGLLFMCYQADIFEQFEFIQRTWSNFSNFPRANTGLDPVIGQDNAYAPAKAQNWPTQWGKEERCPISFAGHVRMKGGEYFFSPSLSFLKSLG